ncbi:dihydroorotase [Membranihabitans marinus]|uniref:dihydroorotase n=1 Tax=Membranihabitans marinus TaxID=1227546 RepID=UPI001F02BFD9|nr:dihydroorotase [Membranihabitans marinus]
MSTIGLRNAKIVNEGKITTGDLLIENDRISIIGSFSKAVDVDIDLEGDYLLPGVIDDQVHFREPGMEWKANIYSESRAALAGGVTSFMEMPNTKPPAITQSLLEDKYQIAKRSSAVNYSFFMGVSNDNLEEVLATDPKTVCGLKIFMGSSTGNMLVDDMEQLEKVFAQANMLIATHCENEYTIRANTAFFQSIYGEDIPFELHPAIRSRQACYLSSQQAVELAQRHNARLHILHISTADELYLFRNDIPLEEKRITAEVCVHHLSFNSNEYSTLGGKIKCNPAIKHEFDQRALLQGLMDDKLDIVATDHAPHTKEEKDNNYSHCPSGLPLVQHSLIGMVDLFDRGLLQDSIDEAMPFIVRKMSHAPAICFDVAERGFIREGYKADLVQLSTKTPQIIQSDNIRYHCQWSPFEGRTFKSKVLRTFINGKLAYDNDKIVDDQSGERLTFDRQ